MTENGKRWNYSLVFLTELNLVKVVHPFIHMNKKKINHEYTHFYSCFTCIIIIAAESERAYIPAILFGNVVSQLNPLKTTFARDFGRFCAFID